MTRSRVQFSLAAPFVQLSVYQFPSGSALTWVPAWVWRGWCFGWATCDLLTSALRPQCRLSKGRRSFLKAAIQCAQFTCARTATSGWFCDLPLLSGLRAIAYTNVGRGLTALRLHSRKSHASFIIAKTVGAHHGRHVEKLQIRKCNRVMWRLCSRCRPHIHFEQLNRSPIYHSLAPRFRSSR
jgi:hypothetical protein